MDIPSNSNWCVRAFRRCLDVLRPPEKPRFYDEARVPESLNFQNDLMESLGSVIGSNHLGRGGVPKCNNQDAFRLEVAEGHAILVVCDGCSSARNSEVGAKLLASLVLNAFKVHATSDKTAEQIVAAVEKTAIEGLRAFVSQLTAPSSSVTGSGQGEDYAFAQTVCSYFLSTVIGAYCSREGGFIWGLGDGVYGYNEDGVPHIEVVRSQNNTPSYLGYNLLKEWPKDVPHKRMSVYKEFKRLPECLMVGSDGVEDLIRQAGRNFPGSEEKIPLITDLLVDKRFISSPDIIGDLLVRMQQAGRAGSSTAASKAAHSEKLLYDDTTLLLIGKRSGVAAPTSKPRVVSRGIQDLKTPKMEAAMPEALLPPPAG